MLQLKKLQTSKPAGRGIYITKELPKKTREFFDIFAYYYPKEQTSQKLGTRLLEF